MATKTRKALGYQQVLGRMRKGDFPTTSGGATKVIFDDGAFATMKTMRGLLEDNKVLRPRYPSVNARWILVIDSKSAEYAAEVRKIMADSAPEIMSCASCGHAFVHGYICLVCGDDNPSR